MKKSMYRRLQWRLIKKTKSRFLSVFLIIFIGTAFFSGLRVTPYAMRNSANQYLHDYNFVDISAMTTYGITQEDIKVINKLDVVSQAIGAYQFDAISQINEVEDGITVYSYSEDNSEFFTPCLVEGRLPLNDDECLVDQQYILKNENIEIGSKITIKNNEYEKEFTISGSIKDTRYMIYHSRGINSYGTGSSEGYLLLPINECKNYAISQDMLDLIGEEIIYNQILITIKGVDSLNYYSDEYESLVNEALLDIEECLQSRVDERYLSIIADKQALLEEPKQQYNQGLAEFTAQKAEFETSINEAKLQLIDGKIQILENKKVLISNQEEFQSGMSSITDQISKLQEELNTLQRQIDEARNTTEPNIPQDGEEDNQITIPDIANSDIDSIIDNVQTTISTISSSLGDISLMVSGMIELEKASLLLEKADIELTLQEQQLALTIEEANAKFDEAEEELNKAKQQIEAAEEEINKIPKGAIYTFTLYDNDGTSSFKNDSNRIAAIAVYFPLIFFLVAALVSLTTMTRMVEEQRSQNGTLRALGYTKTDILVQYITYALLATLLGSVAGILFGCIIFPMIIYGLYTKMMYDIPQTMLITYETTITVLTLVFAIATSLLATTASCMKELSLMPAILMRPKAPKAGKRTILEKIPFLWKHFSFNQKVTSRNIIRYKKRFFMSLIGIAGCTSLLVVGYGIRYSITDMIYNQFNDLWIYDAGIYLQNNLDEEVGKEFMSNLKEYQGIDEVLLTYQKTIESKKEGELISLTLIIPDSVNRFSRYIGLYDYKTGSELTIPEDSIIITEKYAEKLNIKKNDTIKLEIDGVSYDVVVSAIAKNYLGNYAYLSSAYYQTLTENKLVFNSGYINIDSSIEENSIAENLIKDDEILAVSFNSGVAEKLDKQMQSIDIVVWVLIISAGLLAFVVIYNLTNININERISEIATIKVLGFRDHEVYDYVFRENKVLTVLGCIIGLFLGVILHQFIIKTVEINGGMFERRIRPISFLYSSLLTIMFTYIIEFVMRKILRKVDMIESLKSIE